MGKFPARPVSLRSQSRSPVRRFSPTTVPSSVDLLPAGKLAKIPARRIKLKSLRHPWQVQRPFMDQRLAVEAGDPTTSRSVEADPDFAVGGDPDIIRIVTNRDRFPGCQREGVELM